MKTKGKEFEYRDPGIIGHLSHSVHVTMAAVLNRQPPVLLTLVTSMQQKREKEEGSSHDELALMR